MITEFIGPDKRIDEISDGEVAALIASRRQQQIVRPRKKPKKEALTRFASNSTINRTAVVPLKAVLVRARRTWKVPLPKEPNWKDHWQKMPEERVRELQPMEAEALDGSVRSDYADWFEFARVTGLRRNETLLRWSNVNEIGRQIVTIGKRDRKVVTPITPTVKSILDRCRGHHPEFVFTYICKRPKGDQKKGARYPITPEGAKTEWRRLSKRSGVTDFRFHDIRHDVATKVLRRTGKLPMVQKVLSHANIATTARYAHILDEEVADALEENAKSQKKSQTKTKNAA
jgi:integrase